ncbi:MAG: 2,3-bisphosphoglycerate-independent phosphoglycerate mutase [Anaerovibrio sp.]|uniref:2,3-bisphosphoglycerate-independent phosphoglycerate mutase n=1 Tax=Anaerovibrio sp. TaxID=1872532 RepID=UPI001B13221C|nr:2,3-bisphosphoglycerate-independent phosphoglycerate mutase [Anaerovibrio sp.]MBO6245321.1 2,3-bisphosphoglycerate-independent phosphoglycerate mutase [Anaerovibrio sp.]MBP3231331.1 2,3-bisphosphoglycerate-independent phosphoglycerate mutase [Anaerovibrio sp.]
MAKLKNAPVALIIMDGYGNGKTCDPNNAIQIAKTPVIDSLRQNFPSTHIQASGEFVGLPNGQMGNSEVGHTNIGAGRIIYQALTRITKAIKDGDFFKNEALVSVADQAKANGGALHLMGLVSPGGVHSHSEHLYGLLQFAKNQGFKDVYVHAFLDGRDVDPSSAAEYVAELESKIAEIGCGKIASLSGRYYAMDRDNRWDRVQKAYEAIALGKGVAADDAVAGVKASYANEVTDEFVVPAVVGDYKGMKDGDGVVFFNFRPDRARELTHAFTDIEFSGFERKALKLSFATMTQYEEGLNVKVAYPPESITNTLGEVISKNGMTQLRIAETEKYAHVTFFFNGGVEEPYKGEDRILVPSPKVATYDLQPEMSAIEVTDKVVEAIKSGKYDFIILNYANGDMVGHTGVIEAAVKAVETVDTCVGRFVEAIREVGGEVCITADHGNADQMVDPETGAPFTAHTTNPVPFIVVSDRVGWIASDGALCDIAPTLLTLAGMEIPAEMTGTPMVKLK